MVLDTVGVCVGGSDARYVGSAAEALSVLGWTGLDEGGATTSATSWLRCGTARDRRRASGGSEPPDHSESGAAIGRGRATAVVSPEGTTSP